MRFASCVVMAAAVLALAGQAYGRPTSAETIPEVVKKADYLVVGQVVKVEDVAQEQSDTFKMAVMHKRVTIHALRAMKSADASGAEVGDITVDYLGTVGDGGGADMPMFPQLAAKQIAVFPIKRVGETWRFVSDEDVGMIAPASATEIGAGWPADVDGNVAFIYRELAGAVLYGDFSSAARVGRYVDTLRADKQQPVDYIFALMKAEISDSLLREDTRWMTVGVGVYVASAAPRPTLDALINGMVAEDGVPRAPTDALPATPSLRLTALTLRKTAKGQIAERMLMLLISHQEDPEVRWGVAKALVDNFAEGPAYNGVPMLVAMEQQEFRRGKPGALYVADYIVKGPTSPLAEAAVKGACEALAPDGIARELPKGVAFTPELREAQGLILRAGSDEDYKLITSAITGSKMNNAHLHEALLLLAGDNELSPPARVLDICKRYMDEDTEMSFPPFPTFRLCDMAALTAARVGKQDFGFSPTDPIEKRNAAIARAAEWFKKQEPAKPNP